MKKSLKKGIIATCATVVILGIGAGIGYYTGIHHSALRRVKQAAKNVPSYTLSHYEVKDNYHGIDISHHNKITDFNVLANGIDFVYHKATEGATIQDKKFTNRMNKFLDMGIPFGAYHYFTSLSSAKAQFDNFRSVAPTNLPLIPVIDIEDNKGKWSSKKLNAELAEFIRLCEEHYGVTPIIYSSSGFYTKNHLDQHNCDFWSGDIGHKPQVKAIIHQTKIIPVKGMKGKVDYDVAEEIPFNYAVWGC